MEQRSVNGRGVPALLLFLTLLPIVMGVVRAGQVGLDALPEEAAKFAATPLALAIHGLCGATFGLIAPWQFWQALRRRHGPLHRHLGRLYVAAGVGLGLTGMVMVLAYRGGPSALTDIARVVFSAALIGALWLAVSAIRRGQRARHMAWMIRAYALGMGTAPIVFFFIPWIVILGEEPGPVLSEAVFLGTWVASLVAAELVIRRLGAPRPVSRLAPQA